VNPDTGAVITQEQADALPAAKRKPFRWQDVPREEIEAAYVEAHHGQQRAGRRHMQRDMKAGRIHMDALRILARGREGAAS